MYVRRNDDGQLFEVLDVRVSDYAGETEILIYLPESVRGSGQGWIWTSIHGFRAEVLPEPIEGEGDVD